MIVQLLGYLASLLVFSAFYMRTMLPLRCAAIASNVAFIAYGWPLHLWPVVILHGLLLPLNVLRLFQIRRMLAQIQSGGSGEVDIQPLIASLHRERHARGTTLFRKGEQGDRAYYVASGEVVFPERHARVGRGEVFGEIAVFSPGKRRTASAVCGTDVELYRIDGAAVAAAFHQSPAFAFALVRLITRRLVENIGRLETEQKTQ